VTYTKVGSAVEYGVVVFQFAWRSRRQNWNRAWRPWCRRLSSISPPSNKKTGGYQTDCWILTLRSALLWHTPQ
jgi:hypothetical protein